jgi:hypothetical protein
MIFVVTLDQQMTISAKLGSQSPSIASPPVGAKKAN